MNFKLKKCCDRCKARKTIKRYSFMRHFNYGYGYMGFDLCDDCFNEFEKWFDDWFLINPNKTALIEPHSKAKTDKVIPKHTENGGEE